MKNFKQINISILTILLMFCYTQMQAQYCTPSYQAYGTIDGDYIDGVELGTISNLNSGTQGGPSYTDYGATFSTQLNSGSGQVLTVSNNPGFDEDVAAWIDYNQDQVFDASELLGEVRLYAGTSNTITFIVPGGVTTGYTTKMRVRLVYNGAPGIDPCSDYDYGETEDYAVEILPAVPLDIWTQMWVSPDPSVTIPCGNSLAKLRLMNTGLNTINFVTTPMTITGGVTGIVTQTFANLVISTGTLAPGATKDLNLGTVNMSLPGNYIFSATATITGDGYAANNSLTKSVDIGPEYTPPYLETFSAAVVADWTGEMYLYAANDHGNTSDVIGTNLYSGFTYDYTVSPKFKSITANTYLIFDYRFVDNMVGYPASTISSSDSLLVSVSTNCGNTYSPLYTISAANHTPSTSMQSVAVPLSAFVGSKLTFKLEAIWGAGDYWVDMDNIEVRNIFPIDVEVVAINKPLEGACGNPNQSVPVTIRNKGANPVSSIPISVAVTGATPAILSTTYTGTLAPGQSANVTVGTINTVNGGTVTLAATATKPGDGNVSNNSLSKSVLINIVPSAPTAANTAICTGSTATLTGSGGATNAGYHWYDANSGLEVFKGSPFVTPALSANATYNLAYSASVSASLGKSDNTGSGIGNAYFPNGLKFTANNGFVIDSLLIYPNGAGDVVVNVLNNLGVIVGSTLVIVNPATAHDPIKIPVGITVPSAGNYSIDANGSAINDLFYNYTNVSYPYTDATNSLTITGPINGITSHYYFFYDWDISTLACESPITNVTVTVNQTPPTAAFSSSINQATGLATFTSASIGANTYTWDFGDASPLSNAQNPTHTYTVSGSYTVSLIVGNACGSDTINDIVLGADASLLTGIKVYPNPTQNVLNITLQEVDFANASLVLYDSKGAKMAEKSLDPVRGNAIETLDMTKLASGVYILQLNDGTNSAFLKVVKE